MRPAASAAKRRATTVATDRRPDGGGAGRGIHAPAGRLEPPRAAAVSSSTPTDPPAVTLRRPQPRRPRPLAAPVLAALALALVAFAPQPAAADDYGKAERQRIETLPPEYRGWLEEVELIITDEELAAFFELEKDYQRDAFIERFWRVRDVYSDTARNEYRERWEERVFQARQEFGGLKEDRSRILLLNGPPAGRLVSRCSLLKPLELWYYDGSDQVRFEFFVIFYRDGSVYRLWRPFDGVGELTDTLMGRSNLSAARDRELLQVIVFECVDGEQIAGAIARILNEGISYEDILGRLQETPEIGAKEWVATFNAYSTEIDPDAPRLPGELTLAFPGRHQSRTVVEGTLAVPTESATPADLAGHRSYNLMLTGEVLREGELFDNFRLKYDLPVAEVASERLPLVFLRHLRPGDYQLVVKLEDLNGGRFYREERPISVPQVGSAPPPPPEDEETARLLAEAHAALSTLDTTLQIVEPAGEIQTGYVRFDTLVTGDGIDRVTFSLDGDALLTKRIPPWSVDLDLGAVPRPRELEVVALAADGTQLARDALLINAGGNRFSVDLVEPRKGQRYERSLSARAAVEAPEGQVVERVEFFLDETRVATLYQEPWEQPIVLPPGDGVAYVRAVAYLPDGNSTEDLVFVNAPDFLEEIDVQFVEVFAAVLDRSSGRPVEGLAREDFTVVEDGRPQEIVRFERVRDLPIHASVLLDVSASMEGKLEPARQAALGFFEAAIQPKDRGAVITFNDYPHLAVKFTNDVRELAGGLAGLKPERGTALYDSVVFALYYFNGIKGQRALVVLSDGKDESSRFSWEQTLEYARRAGVAIYTVALRDKAAHKKLSELARVTGGRSFLIDDASELAAIYDEVQRELRSKYLVAYQSSNTSDSKDFRAIGVRVARAGTEVKAMQGYYP